MKKNFILIVLLIMILSSAGSLPDQNDLSTFDISGTRWNLLYKDSLLGEMNYEVEFVEGNVFRYNEEADITPDNDFWEQDGNTVYIYINDRYAKYEGHIVSYDLITGTAKNVNNLAWEFKLIRITRE